MNLLFKKMTIKEIKKKDLIILASKSNKKVPHPGKSREHRNLFLKTKENNF